MDAPTVCPRLGVPGDRTVRYSYPNALNVCYADRAGWTEFRPLESAYQRQFCVVQDHVLCPTYLASVATAQRNGKKLRSESHLQFFGLREEPFYIVPQPRFLCESESQKQAHGGLRWLIDQHHGLGLLYGSVGTGKTLLCRALYEELTSDPQCLPVLLLTPSYHSEYALMSELLAQWNVHPDRRRSTYHLEAAAHDFLAGTVLDQNKTPVLILDEAQTLPTRLLQQVCRLLNWQDGGQQLLQVVLAGQPGLQRGLSHVRALHDRAVVEFTLSALTRSDTQRVITERLYRAGRRGDLFAPSAVGLIYEHTGGMPRRVTIMCLKSLWHAYTEGKRYITRDVVQEIIEDGSGSDLFALSDKRAAHIADGRSTTDHWTPAAWLRSLLQQLRPRAAA